MTGAWNGSNSKRQATRADTILHGAIAGATLLWSLSDASGYALVLSDEARHAMNGALIHDWIASGRWLHPMAYALRYYSQWPALSLSYHPPLFPAFEALIYFGLGVNAFAARVAVGLATAVAVFWLLRLITTTHNSPTVALTSLTILLFTPWSQELLREVMLEWPALALLAMAFLVLMRSRSRFSWRQGTAFALLAGAAVWTKQEAVFAGAVPLLYCFLSRRCSALRSQGPWVATGLFCLFVLSLDAWSPSSGLFRRIGPLNDVSGRLLHNIRVYLTAAWGLPGAFVLLAAAGLLVPVARQRRTTDDNALYWSWIIAALPELLIGGWASDRYLFIVLPAIVVLGCATLFRILETLHRRAAVVVLATVAAVYAVAHLQVMRLSLPGPVESARVMITQRATRVLYCGETDGQFIFALRSIGGPSSPIVIRGQKLSADVFTSAGLERFAHDYGISHVVLERTGVRQPWDQLDVKEVRWLRPYGDIRLGGAINDTLHLYRFIDPSPTPLNTLTVPTSKLEGVEQLMILDWSRPL
jgi:hypothetical protein